MPKIFTPRDEAFLRLLSDLIGCNPFTPRRSQIERELLGDEFQKSEKDWTLSPSQYRTTKNLDAIHRKTEKLLERISSKLKQAGQLSPKYRDSYWDLVNYVLFNRNRSHFEDIIKRGKDLRRTFADFKSDVEKYLKFIPGRDIESEPHHLFAIQFQIYRSFYNIFGDIVGSSPSIIKLRADAWQSIFTHDMTRYRHTLFDRMHDFTTLITGPSGTGKELVAKAIGTSAYIPFDTTKYRFKYSREDLLKTVNLSALTPTLIESELFGHKKGAFTGAVTDRLGWLDSCPKEGSIFLDEIGELDATLQVKLLRVLQDRSFQRIGDTADRQFQGRFIAATNRNLDLAIRENSFRSDFYYRICSDRIQTPGLSIRIQEDSSELQGLVRHLSERLLPTDDAKTATDQIVDWIHSNLGLDYPWPGNVRELEQCIRNWLIRRNYAPMNDWQESDSIQRLADFDCTAEELIQRYCASKYAQNGSYVKTAELLGLDRRTVKAKIEALDNVPE